MTKAFDMELFLVGVLSGATATRERHIRQAKIIQAAIAKRWGKESPWAWQAKHIIWFQTTHLNNYSEPTRYRYKLTIKLILYKLGKSSQEIKQSIAYRVKKQAMPPVLDNSYLDVRK